VLTCSKNEGDTDALRACYSSLAPAWEARSRSHEHQQEKLMACAGERHYIFLTELELH